VVSEEQVLGHGFTTVDKGVLTRLIGARDKNPEETKADVGWDCCSETRLWCHILPTSGVPYIRLRRLKSRLFGERRVRTQSFSKYHALRDPNASRVSQAFVLKHL